MKNKEFGRGIQTYESILAQSPDSVSEKLALYQLVMVYKNDLKNSESAQKYLAVLQQKYPAGEL